MAKWTSEEVAIIARNPKGRTRDIRRKLAAAGFRRDNASIAAMRQKLKAQETTVAEYPEGHFTAPVRAPSKLHPEGWPPRFESAWHVPFRSAALLAHYATANKEAGKGHAGLPLNLPGAAKVKPRGVK